MKNNRGMINSADAEKLVTSIGDPSLIGSFHDFATEGTRSIILLDLADPNDIKIYDEISNNTEDYEVLDEVEHHGRYTVFITMRFVRKTPWPPEGRPVSSLHLPKNSGKSPKGKSKAPKKGPKVAGFSLKASRS